MQQITQTKYASQQIYDKQIKCARNQPNAMQALTFVLDASSICHSLYPLFPAFNLH